MAPGGGRGGDRGESRAAGLILSPLLDEWERGIAQRAFDLWAAFAGFCAERMGIEAGKLLGVAIGPGPEERMKELEDLAERLGIEPEAETVAGEREELERAWTLIEERGV